MYLAGSICVYVFGSLFGMVVEFDKKKKKKVCWKEMIKARERYLTGSFKKKKFGRLFGIDFEFDPKEKRFVGKKLYKGHERNVTAGNLKIIMLKKIACWNLESPGKKLTDGKKCEPLETWNHTKIFKKIDS